MTTKIQISRRVIFKSSSNNRKKLLKSPTTLVLLLLKSQKKSRNLSFDYIFGRLTINNLGWKSNFSASTWLRWNISIKLKKISKNYRCWFRTVQSKSLLKQFPSFDYLIWKCAFSALFRVASAVIWKLFENVSAALMQFWSPPKTHSFRAKIQQ